MNLIGMYARGEIYLALPVRIRAYTACVLALLSMPLSMHAQSLLRMRKAF